ncbi:hypothetical protein DU19_1015 [Chlamydia muridarum]|jgi:hypothetical protein|nr:hypothetical protein TAC_04865 [Chlamydia muridarum str. Nigg3 CMUT3-5]AHH24232.1 hypothetical protein Y015_04865 [Chlamydia muridarum str. Nigg CM972]KDU80700.1 hypothetical protein DU17_1016 [Chlamydia muridarum]KDU81954.1 hypothetical protein DU18_1015 [Chlamydia muridarum]KDU81996.1 hypothetical protein DU19_1015 [Chlamydia muridarum]
MLKTCPTIKIKKLESLFKKFFSKLKESIRDGGNRSKGFNEEIKRNHFQHLSKQKLVN